MCLLHHLGGASSRRPEELSQGLSTPAADLMKRAFDDVDPRRLVDYHTHVVGVGAGGTGNLVNPAMRSRRRPLKYLKFLVYLSAAGIKDLENADREFVLRLADQARHIADHGKYRLLAFDKHYTADGTVNAEKTEFYTANEHVFNLAAEFPDLFLPTMSVHPYRADALEELARWAGRGVKVVKWLPNAMGIDPSDPRCDPFYRSMRELGAVLLSHAGEEKAVEAEEDQRLGNPLHLRRPLDHGVKVIAAHCAGLGENPDLDHPDRRLVPNFQLFMRLMEQKRYEGLLFGDISAMTQRNRLGVPPDDDPGANRPARPAGERKRLSAAGDQHRDQHGSPGPGRLHHQGGAHRPERDIRLQSAPVRFRVEADAEGPGSRPAASGVGVHGQSGPGRLSP